MKKISQHTKIFISIILGLLFALIHIKFRLNPSIKLYIKPFGIIFINSLKASAIPLTVSSLVVGVSGVEDNTRLSRIASKTFLMYTLTTIFSVILGLFIGNVVRPGDAFSPLLRAKLMAQAALEGGLQVESQSWVDTIVNLVPSNIFKALSSNGSLLQVVIISIVFALALSKVSVRRKKLVIMFFEGVNEAFMEIIQLIMSFAPIAVFSLISCLLIELSQGDTAEIVDYLYGLAWYTGTVLMSLGLMTFFVYPLLASILTKVKFSQFLNAMRPAQLVGFSTSSSSATLPVTIKQVEDDLGVPEDVSGFVLPIGATVNMDGTALYQGIATLFMAQAFGLDLSWQQQLTVVLYVTSSSIGVAGVPGASIATTTMLLDILGIPAQGLTLILIPDRLLDMCRTATNITSDGFVALLVAYFEGLLEKKEPTFDDY